VKKLAALLLVIGLVSSSASYAQRRPVAPGAAAPAPTSAATASAPAPTASAAPADKIELKKIKSADNYVTLNFTNIDINALIKVMSELTRRNFILDEKVAGKVTIMTPTKMSPDEAYQVFLSALEIKGFTTMEDGSVTRIIPAAMARQSGIKVFQDGDTRGEGFVTQLIRMKFVNPQDILRTIGPLISKDGNLIAYPNTNSLIITDSVSNIKKIESLVHAIDVAAPEGKGKINVYNLTNANADDLAKLLTALVARLPVPPPPGSPQPVNPSTILEGAVNISADKSTNSLIVVASPGDYETVKDVIQKLDVRRRQVYVEVSIIELSLSKMRDLGFEFEAPIKTSNLGEGATSAVVGGTNFGNIGNVIANGPAALAQMSGLAVGAIKGTFTFQGKQYLSVGALLHALQTDGDVNVLSTPNILTMDNQKAEIMVGQNVPFITGQTQNATTGSQSLFNTVTRQDVGIKLSITPQIASSDNVRLEVNQEISDVIASTLTNVAGPTTSKRSAITAVVVKDRQTMVIGGLIRDNVTSSTSKVPFLGDIPLLGWLFKSKTTSIDKTNLMIFITPYIINNEGESGELAKQKNDAMEKWREEYRMEKKSGSLQPMLKPLDKTGSVEPAMTSADTGTTVGNESYPTPSAPAAGPVESAPASTESSAPAAGAVKSAPTTTASSLAAPGAMESAPTTTESSMPAAGAVESAATTSASPAPAEEQTAVPAEAGR
jgi:general secretion pathway protein D